MQCIHSSSNLKGDTGRLACRRKVLKTSCEAPFLSSSPIFEQLQVSCQLKPGIEDFSNSKRPTHLHYSLNLRLNCQVLWPVEAKQFLLVHCASSSVLPTSTGLMMYQSTLSGLCGIHCLTRSLQPPSHLSEPLTLCSAGTPSWQISFSGSAGRKSDVRCKVYPQARA